MALQISNAPIPLQDPIAKPRKLKPGEKPDQNEGMCSDTWAYYLTSLTERLQQTPNRVGSVALTDQGASIPGVDFSGGSLNAGVYRISYIARITGIASGSSSLQVTLSWVDHGVSLSMSGSAMVGNTVATLQQGGGLIYVDSGTPVAYSTTYASVGASSMKYQLYILLETAFLDNAGVQAS